MDIKTIQCVSVGQKDQNKGMFHLWQEIFQLPRTKRYRMVQLRIFEFFLILSMLEDAEGLRVPEFF